MIAELGSGFLEINSTPYNANNVLRICANLSNELIDALFSSGYYPACL
jgi:hypothetical protein